MCVCVFVCKYESCEKILKVLPQLALDLVSSSKRAAVKNRLSFDFQRARLGQVRGDMRVNDTRFAFEFVHKNFRVGV